MDSSVLVFSLLIILEVGRSSPVDRKSNIETNVAESFENSLDSITCDTEDKDVFDSVEQFCLSSFEDNEEDYESESEHSIYA